MDKTLLSVFMVTIMSFSILAVPMAVTSVDATANDGLGQDVSSSYEQYFIERLTSTVSLEEYQGISNDALTTIQYISYTDYISSRHSNPMDYVDIYISYVGEYLSDHSCFDDYLSTLIVSDSITISEQTRGGVNKIESFSYGYDIYISSEYLEEIGDWNSIGAGALVTLLGVNPVVGIALAAYLALNDLEDIYPNGVVVEYRTGYPIDVFGITVVIPYPTPMCFARSQ